MLHMFSLTDYSYAVLKLLVRLAYTANREICVMFWPREKSVKK